MNLCVVIYFTSSSKKYNLTIGGAEKQFFQSLPEYENKVERLSIITNFTSFAPKKKTTTIKQSLGNYSRFFSPIINHILIRKLRIVSILFYVIFVSYNIIRIHQKNRIDFLNIHILDSAYYPVLLLTKILGIKTMYKPSGELKSTIQRAINIKQFYLQNVLYYVSTNLIKKVILLCDCIQALNEGIKEELIEDFDYPEQRIALISNGVEIDDYKGIYNSSLMNLGYVGRLEKIKNIMSMIYAFSKVEKIFPEYKLLLYGEGPERTKIEAYIRKFDLHKKIELHGFENDRKKIYSSFNIFILPSISEGISNSLLEAIAVGMPIIASNIKGNKLLINDGVEGVLFNPNEVDELKDKIIYLIENPSFREKIRINAKSKVENEFDIKITARKLLQFMNSILRNHIRE